MVLHHTTFLRSADRGSRTRAKDGHMDGFRWTVTLRRHTSRWIRDGLRRLEVDAVADILSLVCVVGLVCGGPAGDAV